MFNISNRNEIKLTRTAVRIYLYLIKRGESLGVREIARALSLSPSTVHYHLKRLEELDLITKEGDGYKIKKIVSLDELIVLGKHLIPRLSIYSFFFLGVLLGLTIIATTKGLNIDRALAIAISFTAFLILFTEGLKTAKRY